MPNEKDKKKTVDEIGINDIIEDKPPKTSLSKLEIGTIKLGTNNKTKYMVQLNKGGRKFWKKI